MYLSAYKVQYDFFFFPNSLTLKEHYHNNIAFKRLAWPIFNNSMLRRIKQAAVLAAVSTDTAQSRLMWLGSITDPGYLLPPPKVFGTQRSNRDTADTTKH